MDSFREQQIEALEMAIDYMDKLIPSMEEVVGEIKGEMKEDTIDFLHQIIDGLNFMIETYNATEAVVCEDKPLINREDFEEVIGRLSDGFSKKDYVAIADELEKSIVPFLKNFRDAAKKVK